MVGVELGKIGNQNGRSATSDSFISRLYSITELWLLLQLVK